MILFLSVVVIFLCCGKGIFFRSQMENLFKHISHVWWSLTVLREVQLVLIVLSNKISEPVPTVNHLNLKV